MWNYTGRYIAPATVLSIGIVRFQHLNSLFDCVKCTPNMAEWSSMTSLHRTYLLSKGHETHLVGWSLVHQYLKKISCENGCVFLSKLVADTQDTMNR